MTESFDPSAYQIGRNGPLKPDIQDFLRRTRDDQHWSYAVLGRQLGISATFIYNLLNKQARIGTRFLPDVIRQVERLKAGDFALPSAGDPAGPEQGNGMLNHSYNLRSDLQLNIWLPEDLTEREAERLALFVRSLAS